MKFQLILVTVLSMCVLNAQNLLKNNGFEVLNQNSDFAASWRQGTYKGAEGTIQLDKENAGSEKYAIHLEQTSPKGWLGCYQTVLLKEPLKSSRKVTWSIKVCSDRLKSGQLVIIAGTKEKPQAQWVSVQNWSGTSEWKTFSQDLMINPGTDRVTFSIRTSGPGSLWADNCSLIMEEDPELVVNGSMSGSEVASTGLPERWKIKMYHGLEADGTAALVKKNYRNKNSILLKWSSGARRFGVEAKVEKIKPGTAVYKASAEIKTTGEGKALFGIELLDGKGNKLDEFFSAPMASADWRNMDFIFNTSQETTSFRLYCLSGETDMVYWANVSCQKLDRKTVQASLPLAARIEPVEWSKVWNGGKKEFTSFAEAPLPLSFHFKGQKSKLKKAALIIEVPVDLNIADAFCMHTGNYGREIPHMEKIKRPEGEYTRYTFENIRPFKILQNEYGWARKLIIVIDSAKESDKEPYKIFWHLRNDDQQTPEETFELKIVSLPSGNLPKDFRILRWESDDYLYTNNNLLLKTLQALEKSGMTINRRQPNKFERGVEINNLLEKRGWNFKIGTPNYLQVRFFPQKYLKQLNGNEEFVVKANGTKNSKEFCPDYFTDDLHFIEIFQGFLKDVILRYDIKPGEIISMDVEPWGTMDWCFCDRSRKKFADKLKLTHIPNVAEIRKTYSSQWIEFRCENTARIVQMHQETIKRNFPELLLADYDYVVDFKRNNYQSNFSGVAKDPVMNEAYFDMHIASYYHYIDKKAFDMIRMNTRNLKKSYMPICAIDKAGGYLTTSEIISPAQARLMLLAAAVNGSAGFGIYPGMHLDAQYFQTFIKGMNEIAILEKYFKHGRTDAQDVSVSARPYQTCELTSGGKLKVLRFPHWDDYLAFSAVPMNSERLVSIFNYHPNNIMFADIKTEFPNGEYTVFDPISQITYLPANGRKSWNKTELQNGILIKIEPREVRFILIRPFEAPEAAGQNLTKSELENDFKKTAKIFGGQEAFKTIRSNGLSIDMVDSNHDGTPEIELASSKQKLRIDYARSGALINWEVQGKIVNDVTFLINKIWLPKEFRGNQKHPYAIQNAIIASGRAEIVLAKTLSSLPLEIQKAVSIDAQSTSFQVNYQLKNIGQSPVHFSFWLANQITGSQNTTPKFFIEQSGQKVQIMEKNGTLVYPSGSTAAEGHKQVSGILSAPGSAMQLGEHKITITLSKKHLMNYYFWLSSAVNTWEWMYRPVTLAPGQIWQTSIDVNAKLSLF